MKRSREPDDEFLDSPGPEGDGAADHAVSSRESSATPLPPPAAKIVQLDPDAASPSLSPSNRKPTAEMKCSLPPHPPGLSFPSYEEYEAHYHKAHTNRCLECRKNFPSEHILSLHIEECHDSLAAVRREKGEHTVSTQLVIPFSLLRPAFVSGFTKIADSFPLRTSPKVLLFCGRM